MNGSRQVWLKPPSREPLSDCCVVHLQPQPMHAFPFALFLLPIHLPILAGILPPCAMYLIFNTVIGPFKFFGNVCGRSWLHSLECRPFADPVHVFLVFFPSCMRFFNHCANFLKESPPSNLPLLIRLTAAWTALRAAHHCTLKCPFNSLCKNIS